MKKNIFFLLLFIYSFSLGQSNRESLLRTWNNNIRHDTIRVKALLNHVKLMDEKNMDSSLYLLSLAENFSDSIQDIKLLSRCYFEKGELYREKGIYDKAISNYEVGINLLEENGYEIEVGKSLLKLASIFKDNHSVEKAITIARKAEQIFIKNEKKELQAKSLYVMGKITEKDANQSFLFFYESLELAKIAQDSSTITLSYLCLGANKKRIGKYEEALKYYNEAKKYAQLIKEEYNLYVAYNNLGSIYRNMGNYKEAINHYNLAINVLDKLELYVELGGQKSNLGTVYELTGDFSKALESYKECLDIGQEVNNKIMIGGSYGNIGAIFSTQKDFVKTIGFVKKGIDALEGEKDYKSLYFLSVLYANLGTAYNRLHQEKNVNYEVAELDFNMVTFDITEGQDLLLKSEEALKKGIEIAKSINNEAGLGLFYLNMAKLYDINFLLNKEKVFLNVNKAEELIEQKGTISHKIDLYEFLYKLNKRLENHELALTMYEKYTELKDSLDQEENLRAVIQNQYKTEYKQQALADSIKFVETQKLSKLEIQKQNIELKSQTFRQYILFGGLLLVVLFSVYFIRKNKEIRKQKQEVEYQKEFAVGQQQIAEEQKGILEYQHREIRDSINYAKNLQKSVLPSKADVSQNFPNNFILYKPKDVVSGDFYWTYRKEDLVYLAVIDCTGHGVPGAFMTIVANNLLNEIIQEDYIRPKEIVEELHLRIKLRVGGSSEAQVRDSMDLGLFSYHTATKEVRFVGTHTSICRVRDSQLEQFKGSKADIGYKREIIVQEQVFNVELNDMLYMHTDGYPDQKGGPKGKKFYYQPIRNKFKEISLLNLMEQEQIMGEIFEDWKGETDQFDDVCMVGVRI